MTDEQFSPPGYECCICKETAPHEGGASPLDPCALILVSSVGEPRDRHKEQVFYCHFECFRRLVNDDGILYITEPDFPTVGELAQDGSGE